MNRRTLEAKMKNAGIDISDVEIKTDYVYRIRVSSTAISDRKRMQMTGDEVNAIRTAATKKLEQTATLFETMIKKAHYVEIAR